MRFFFATFLGNRRKSLKGSNISKLANAENDVIEVNMTTHSVNLRVGAEQYSLRSDDDYLNSLGGVWEPQTADFLRQLISSNMTVVDVGANVGVTSLLFSQLARQVYSFEPSPSTFQFLRENIDKAGVKNVEALNLGLGPGGGEHETTLTFSPNFRAGAFVSDKIQPGAGHRSETVKILTGDEFFENRQVDFMKIDVEGFELEVLRGLDSTLKRDRPLVFLEMNHWCLNVLRRVALPDFLEEITATFPHCWAVHEEEIVYLQDTDSRYSVMYRHVVHGHFPNLLCGYDRDALTI